MDFTVTVEKTLWAVNIYINGLLHVQLKHEGYRGLYSSVSERTGRNTKYRIDFYYTDGKEINVWYDTKEKWLAVLKELTPVMK